jgi:hypothetical protein
MHCKEAADALPGEALADEPLQLVQALVRVLDVVSELLHLLRLGPVLVLLGLQRALRRVEVLLRPRRNGDDGAANQQQRMGPGVELMTRQRLSKPDALDQADERVRGGVAERAKLGPATRKAQNEPHQDTK